MDRKERFKEHGLNLGTLVGEKDEHYGEMIESTKQYLLSVFPNGIPVESYSIAGLHIRIFDKLRRSTHSGHDNAEDWRDIAGYGIQGLEHYSADAPEETENLQALNQFITKENAEAMCREIYLAKRCKSCQVGRNSDIEQISCREYIKHNPEQAAEMLRKAVEG